VKSAPDGYTLMIGATSTMAANPSLYTKMNLDPPKDLTPITQVASGPFVLAVPASLPVRTVKELIALARSKPGEINFGSSGVGSSLQLTAELFKSMANIDIVHVPYKGAPAALVDLLAGRVHLTFSVPTAAAHVKSGELRALAVTGNKRIAALPDVPTVVEAGLPDLEFGSWNGLHVPAGTPKPIIEKLNGAVAKARNLADVQTRMRDVGLEPEGGTPAEFGEFVKRDVARWGRIVKETGVKME
jgi:tripartite-type tricarboxylate transporter receptor subunit TctC